MLAWKLQITNKNNNHSWCLVTATNEIIVTFAASLFVCIYWMDASLNSTVVKCCSDHNTTLISYMTKTQMFKKNKQMFCRDRHWLIIKKVRLRFFCWVYILSQGFEDWVAATAQILHSLWQLRNAQITPFLCLMKVLCVQSDSRDAHWQRDWQMTALLTNSAPLISLPHPHGNERRSQGYDERWSSSPLAL